MSKGYGTAPGPFGDQGVPPAPIVSPIQQQEDIRAIREKYYGPNVSENEKLEDTHVFNIAPGTAVKLFDDPNIVVNSIIVTCVLGTASVWLRDNTTQPDQIPHIVVPSGGASPQYILSHTKGRAITIGNPSTAITNVQGTLIVEMV